MTIRSNLHGTGRRASAFVRRRQRFAVEQSALAFSIVGARNASINGRKTASRIAYDLTNNDVLIVSGMARGIDAAAHKGAMYAQEQCGPTAAVLEPASMFPTLRKTLHLYEQIKQNGVIVSESPLGTQPNAANFPRRNRIVAGLGLGTLVVEATLTFRVP
ncbi:MAG: DNA-processing protein DprA [Alphaproteobacteria bacterium]